MAITDCVAPNVGKAACSTKCVFARRAVDRCLLHCVDVGNLVVPPPGKPSLAQLAMALEEVFAHGAETMKDFSRYYEDRKE